MPRILSCNTPPHSLRLTQALTPIGSMYEEVDLVMSCQVTTEIGALEFSFSVESGDISTARLETKFIKPKLPDGMSVERVTAVLLRLKAVEPVRGLKFTCQLGPQFGQGDSCSGEALDAWEWGNGSRIVLIGTEDGDWLGHRLNLGEITRENYPVNYQHNQISIEIDKIERDQEVSLHYIVAENPYPEPKECSCWFAVDNPHKELVSELIQS